ncbi:MAG: glycosyltransferase family 2 protein [Bacteroidales bacterium]
MLLSVILLSWNSEKDVRDCLDSLLPAIRELSHEVIVVDNGSKDNTIRYLQEYREEIRLLRLSENLGVSKGRNVALREAQGNYIWILDIDTIVNRQAITGMIDFLEKHPLCGMCACKLTSDHMEIQDSCRRLPFLHYKIMNLLCSEGVKRYLPASVIRLIQEQNKTQFYREKLKEKIPFETEYLIGACQLLRKEVLCRTGLLDEHIFYGPEDADFCLRIRKLNYTIFCIPELSIVHRYNRISNKRFFSRMSWLHIRGLLYFYAKHRLILPKTTSSP